MTIELVFWLAAAFLALIVAPVVLVWSMVQHFRGRGSERTGSGGISAGVGAALQELDRLVARPSIEHQIDSEHRVLKREDDSGDD